MVLALILAVSESVYADNSCEYAYDGECDEPRLCAPNTDTADCGSEDDYWKQKEAANRHASRVGDDSCEYVRDGECDEPDLCPIGTDTTDCGGRVEEWPMRQMAVGFPSGQILQPCGCWGYVQIGSEWFEAACASKVAVVTWCNFPCPAGGSQWAVQCR